MSSVDVWKCWDSAVGREGCQATNSKLTGLQEQNDDDRNRSVGSTVRSTCADWQTAHVENQWRLLLTYNCPAQGDGRIICRYLLIAVVMRWHVCICVQYVTERFSLALAHKLSKVRDESLVCLQTALNQSVSSLNLWHRGKGWQGGGNCPPPKV